MSYGNNAIHVSEPGKIPKGPHWAILEYESMYIEGDERSRTHPGHGYPGHSVSYVSYRAFTNEDDWKTAVSELANPKFGSPKKFEAMYVVPAQVTTSVKVSVDINAKPYTERQTPYHGR